jgi:hypothetical protein
MHQFRTTQLAAASEGGPGEAVVERETIELTLLAVIQVLPPPSGEVLELTVPAVNSALTARCAHAA